MTLSQFAGRTVDVMAFSGAKERGESQLTPALDGGTGTGLMATGTQKLAQRFLIELLTVKGSIPYKPARGTEFLRFVREGRVHTEFDLFTLFSYSLGDLESNLRREESDDDPDDERFDDANLLEAQLQPGTAVLTIEVVSRAGVGREVILPIATTP